jgi:hypothetical protein
VVAGIIDGKCLSRYLDTFVVLEGRFCIVLGLGYFSIIFSPSSNKKCSLRSRLARFLYGVIINVCNN